MPGAALTTTEKSMLRNWESRRRTQFKNLHTVTITPGPDTVPLRGVSSIQLEFGFPVSVLVGANGSGKTTLLSLAALGYNGDTHVPYGRSRSGYTFVDFFVRSNSEAIPLNFMVTWKYSDDSEITMQRKSPKKWMHYDRRETRPVEFIGLGRIADLSESGVHRRMFGAPGAWTEVELASAIASDMTRILKRKYDKAENFSSIKLRLPVLHADAMYSAFNMGTGEAALFEIISVLHTVPEGSLVLIEEVELGVHSEAQASLAQVIVDIAAARKLQVICTSHSEAFIDELPREARILLTKVEHTHSAITGVTTRTALTNLGGSHTPEARIICEDEVAKQLLEIALPIELREKFQIIPIGAKTILPSSAKTLLTQAPKIPVVIIWDCDVSNQDIRSSYISSGVADLHTTLEAARLDWRRLPGLVPCANSPATSISRSRLAPEQAIKETLLAHPSSLESLATQFRQPSADSFADRLRSAAIGKGSHHDLFHELGTSLASPTEYVRHALLYEYAQIADWHDIEQCLRESLEGHGGSIAPPPAEES